MVKGKSPTDQKPLFANGYSTNTPVYVADPYNGNPLEYNRAVSDRQKLQKAFCNFEHIANCFLNYCDGKTEFKNFHEIKAFTEELCWHA